METLNFCVVQTNNYCGLGKQYVTHLRRQIQRHYSLPHEFHLWTDEPAEDYPGWVVHKARFPGWWPKLQIFEPGVLQGRCAFIDLDTYIVRNIDHWSEYKGAFATLRDFWVPNRLGPAVMLFDPVRCEHIYRTWEASGFDMSDSRGDQGFLSNLDQGRFYKTVDFLQELWPGEFVSYKGEALEDIPNGCTAVCFHGKPRPHEAQGWAKTAWEMGGIAVATYNPVLNTPATTMLKQAEHNLARGLPMFVELEPHDGVALVCGGGPSLADNLMHLRFHHARGGDIFAVGNTANYLLERGIKPDFQVLLDARQENVEFVCKDKGVTKLLAAQCHPDVFDACEGHKIIVWLAHMDGAKALAKRVPHPVVVIGGGSTVGLKTMALVQVWGFRSMRLYGFDSCYRDDRNHAYEQKLNDGENVLDVMVLGKKFRCARWMLRQADLFQQQAQMQTNMGMKIHVTGDGLIPFIAKHMGSEEKADVVANQTESEVVNGY